MEAMNDRPIMVFVPVWREKDEQLRRTLMVHINGVHNGDALTTIFINFLNFLYIFLTECTSELLSQGSNQCGGGD